MDKRESKEKINEDVGEKEKVKYSPFNVTAVTKAKETNIFVVLWVLRRSLLEQRVLSLFLDSRRPVAILQQIIEARRSTILRSNP